MKKKREEEDRIMAAKKKKLVDPFTAEEGFINAVEEDLDYEFEQGVDYFKNTYTDTYNTLDYDI